MKLLGYRSIFVKLFGILIVTGVLINVSVYYCQKYLISPREHFREIARKNLSQYADYMIRDLGVPPSLEKAKEITNRFRVGIRFESPSLKWSTSDTVPAFEDAEKKLLPGTPSETYRYGRDKEAHHFFLILERKVGSESGKFLFYSPGGPHYETNASGIVLLTLILSLIVGLSYLFLRRLLRPIRSLTDGVRKFGSGQLDHKVPADGSDEFGVLARSFNQMTDRISAMIRSREQLLLDVSHELRSPVTRAKVALEFVPDSKAKGQIEEELNEMEAMIQQLLESARLANPYGALNIERVDLVTVVKEVVGRYLSSAHLQCQKEKVLGTVDVARFKTALKNVVENAVKVSPAEKSVGVVVSETPDSVVVTVRDRGPGISKEELGKVFEPFYRVDKSRDRKTGGFGLGLNLCRKIMEAHQGSISIESEEGKGTTVALRLPKSV